MSGNCEVTGERGKFAVGHAVTKIGWYFHEKHSPEYGIDGEIEIVEHGKRSGKLLKVQIKSGPSWFEEVTSTGFTYRGDENHLRYWLAHTVPVLLLLHDTESEITYWEEITRSKVIRTGKNWKIDIPRSQILDREASDALRKIAYKAVHALPNGMWSRHERYELQDGYIRPVLGSRLIEYDPWQSYSSNLAVSALTEKPYISFARLGRKITWSPHSGVALTRDALTEKDKALILEWVTNNGLLGLLPGLAQIVTLWPRWEKPGKMYDSDSEGACMSYIRHLRVGGNWYSTGQMITLPLLLSDSLSQRF
jgi:hypothetical protein